MGQKWEINVFLNSIYLMLRMSMANKRHIPTIILFLVPLVLPLLVLAQPYSSIELKKPTKYENRDLPAEKTGSGRIKGGKKVYQNTVTHFNYFFNAQNKINDVLERAKSSFVEDYTQQLPFYNYTKEDLYKQKEQLDSVLYKCTAGIVLHDLRNAWVDDLYLLMGQAYLYRKDYDSAALVFQYLNYAFAPKEDGYDLPIGSNSSNTNGEFTVVTKESSNLWKKISSTPPGRNEGFLWRIRTYVEQNQLADAFGLIAILRSDPNFPKRLLPHLNENAAYAFYKEGSLDSAATYLVKALDRAVTAQDKARWQFLAGQLYTETNHDSLAVLAYQQSIKATTDPTLEVYARLAISALESGKKANAIQENLNQLWKMAKRPLYEPYRDIIYYAIAQLELKQSHPDLAQKALLSSIAFNDNNPIQKQASFLLLGDLNFDRKNYPDAYRFYDSLQTDQLKEIPKQRVLDRKPSLKTITENIAIIQLEDSLQKLALMPIDQRNAVLKAKLKALRKEAGLKDLDNQEPGFGGGFAGGPSQDADLFATSANEFYFQNAGLKSRGYSEFKAKWGTRPNVDNWRRQSAVEKSFAQKSTLNNNGPISPNNQTAAAPVAELTMESLLAKLPLTSEQMSSSYLAILKASMENAALYQLNLGDYPSAIKEYRGIVTQFPDVSETEKALFNLANCYDRNNQPIQADSVRQLLKTNFANGKYNKLVQEQGKPIAKDQATITYEQVYDLFLSGSFKEALQVKETADKKWGKSYWTPQQLYIEAIYYVKNREDSIAINRLQEISKLFPNSPLKEKANTMVDVLKRRKEIETYLTDLKIERPEEIAQRPIELNEVSTLKKAPAPKAEITQKIAPVLQVKPKTLEPTEKPVIEAVAPQKEDPVIKAVAPPKEKPVIVAVAPPKVDTVRKQPNVVLVDAAMQKIEPVKAAPSNQFVFSANDPHFVAIALDKVDGIFAGEAKNAFNRFNREQYSNQNLAIGNESIVATLQLVLVGPFANAADAVAYINKAKPLAASRIVPWLAPEKYSFLILSGANLTVLKSKKDIQEYRTFLHGVFPDIF